jgi:hypothetical protein
MPLIRGVVVDETGAPIAGARVFFTSAPGPFPDIAALTDEAGKFTVGAPVPGRYSLASAADGFESEEAAVDVGDEGEAMLEIKLSRSG